MQAFKKKTNFACSSNLFIFIFIFRIMSVKRLGNFGICLSMLSINVGKNSFRFHLKFTTTTTTTFNSTCRTPFRYHCHSLYSHRSCRCLCIDFFFFCPHRSAVCRISIDFPFRASRYSCTKKNQTTNIFPHKFHLCLKTEKKRQKILDSRVKIIQKRR